MLKWCILNTKSTDPVETQPDWAAAQKKKRGRKPKVLAGVEAHHKDGRNSDKRRVREERSDTESSDHGELQTQTFSCALLP